MDSFRGAKLARPLCAAPGIVSLKNSAMGPEDEGLLRFRMEKGKMFSKDDPRGWSGSGRARVRSQRKLQIRGDFHCIFFESVINCL